jgi:hypothetical protein
MQSYEIVEEAISFYSNFYMQSNVEVYVWQIHNTKANTKFFENVATSKCGEWQQQIKMSFRNILRAHPLYFSFCRLFKIIKYETGLYKAIIFIAINNYSSLFKE